MKIELRDRSFWREREREREREKERETSYRREEKRRNIIVLRLFDAITCSFC